MIQFTCLALSALTMAAAHTAALPAPAPVDDITVGSPYPPLRLPTIDGRGTISLGELRGTKVLLIEFAAW